MRRYTTRDVESLIGLTPRQSRAYGRSGLLDPERGDGNRYLFSFQDLVLLRTAKELLDGNVPQRRILRALRQLKTQLPTDRSLTELRIVAEGENVVVHDEGQAWDPESGQFRIVFHVADLAARVDPARSEPTRLEPTRLEPIAPAAVPDEDPQNESIGDWLDRGLELESHDPARARAAYEKVLERDPSHVDALTNLGRLLQEDGELEGAVVHYRRALESAGGDAPTAAFNLGLALEDLGRYRAAADAYEASLSADPSFADAHYNLSRLYERSGDRVSALRHLKSYRALTSGGG